MSELGRQWRVSTPDLSPMDIGPEYQSTSSEEDGSEYQPTSSEENGSEDQPTSSEEDELEYQSASSVEDGSVHQSSCSEEDDSEYQPTSSVEEESDNEPHRPNRGNLHTQVLEVSVTLNHHHLRADTELEVGTVFNIGETLELHDGSFLRITELRRSKDGRSVNFSGDLFRRIEEFGEYLPVTFGDSELVWVCEAKERDVKPEGYLRSASSKDVLRIRHLVLANSERASESTPQSQAVGMFTDTRTLSYRWKLVAELSNLYVPGGVRTFRSCNTGCKERPKVFIGLANQEPFVGGAMAAGTSLSQHHLDSDLPKASSDRDQRQSRIHGRAPSRTLGIGRKCRRDAGPSLILAANAVGTRIAKATASPATRKSSRLFEMSLARVLETSPAQITVSEQGIEQHTYTFADAFCGAGGVSVGARDAGLRVEWAFDDDKDAIDTYSQYHGRGSCKQISAEEFLKSNNTYGRSTVDILHLSPPCQDFSRANRRTQTDEEKESKKKESKNNNCITYVGRLVKEVNPRIVTFEEVREVLFRYQGYFKNMVLDLTTAGYSVGWRLIQCADFGVPQKRIRLFMIASRAGEKFPDFPKPTHSHFAYCHDLGLQRWNTFEDAIDNLDDRAPNHIHRNSRMERRIEIWAPPHPPDWPCHRTITTGGNWPDHYNGKYQCTVREAACLQGFPADYKFCGNVRATQKQVANAVPPPVAKAILEEVKRSLMETDASRRS